MFKKIFFLFLFISGLMVFKFPTLAANEDLLNAPEKADLSDTYYVGRVLRIIEVGEREVEPDYFQMYQTVEIEIINGEEKGKKITIDHGGSFAISENQKVKVGEKVVVAKTPASSEGRSVYYIVDTYRVYRLLFIILVFFAVAIYFGRKKGLTSVLGLIFSIVVIFKFIIPLLAAGHDPFLICSIGAFAMLFVSLLVSHGFTRRSRVAIASSFIALALAVVIDWLFVTLAHLSGTGTEEVFYLQFGTDTINVRGLLLGGILIGVLGILDDVTTAQAAAVEEIYLVGDHIKFKELYKRGLSVGREHIAALVNTLILAYAGVSLPLLLLYSSQKTHAFWMTINSAFIAEEIVRTMVGSTVLVLAVPISTFLAAWWYTRKK